MTNDGKDGEDPTSGEDLMIDSTANTEAPELAPVHSRAVRRLFDDTRRRLVETGTRNRLVHVNRANTRGDVVNIINERCGGINGRKLKLSLVEAPPTAPEGQDPAAIAQSACIKATEDNKAVFAWSGTGWGGQGGASCVTGDHDTIYLTTYTISPEDLESSENRLYSTTVSPADGLAAS